MGLFSSAELNTLDDLLVDQLKDLYDAEHRLTDALPKMAEAAATPGLKQAFLSHLEETKNHVLRLEQAFAALGKDPERETCQAMKGPIAEGSQIIDAKGDSVVRDAALMAAAQRVEHYEMAVYGSARTFATQLNFSNVAALLQSTLNEEGAADLGLQAHPFLFSLTLSALADRTEGVRFVGRLATYKYYNMDQGVAQALTTAAKLGGARNSIKWENAGNAE